jgi:hypothetical protein
MSHNFWQLDIDSNENENENPNPNENKKESTYKKITNIICLSTAIITFIILLMFLTYMIMYVYLSENYYVENKIYYKYFDIIYHYNGVYLNYTIDKEQTTNNRDNYNINYYFEIRDSKKRNTPINYYKCDNENTIYKDSAYNYYTTKYKIYEPKTLYFHNNDNNCTIIHQYSSYAEAFFLILPLTFLHLFSVSYLRKNRKK